MDPTEKGAPVITDFSPKSGKVGTEILISGENLQQITKITIGDGEAQFKYRVNAQELVVVVTKENTSGVVTVYGPEQEASSLQDFTITYPVPVLDAYPTEGSPNENVLIEGKDMDVVTGVLFGTASAKIISQTETEMLVEVPYFENGPVAIALQYSDGTETKSVSTSGNVFSLISNEVPEVSEFPITAETGSSVTIRGNNLHLIDNVWFGDMEATVNQRTQTYINVAVPDVTEAKTLTLKLIYFGSKEMTLTNSFVITIPVETSIYFWENRTIYCNDPETTANFFDAVTGKIYTPCQYEEKKNDIYMVMLISASTIRLTNPNNSANATKVFFCNGEALPAETMPNIVKFRLMRTSSGADNKFIEMVKDKTLTEISEAILTENGVGTTSSNNIDYPNLSAGAVLLMKQFDKSGNVLKVGFIEVLEINTTDPTSDKQSSMTFNCYFEK